MNLFIPVQTKYENDIWVTMSQQHELFFKKRNFIFRSFSGEDDLQKLVPIITDWSPEAEEEQVNIVCMFKLASTALKSRDEDLNEAIEALGDREADQEIKAENKKLKKENRELKKENKEQDKQ